MWHQTDGFLRIAVRVKIGHYLAHVTRKPALRLVDRVFQVFSGVTVTFQNLTIMGGKAIDDGSTGALPNTTIAEGGGILSDGIVTLDHVTIDSNEAAGAVTGFGQVQIARLGEVFLADDVGKRQIVRTSLEIDRVVHAIAVRSDDGGAQAAGPAIECRGQRIEGGQQPARFERFEALAKRNAPAKFR
jgi:hypothetical protein